MEIAKIICCTISFITVFLGGLYILNKLMHFLFENHKEKKRIDMLKEQNTQIERLQIDEDKVNKIATQLDEIKKRLEQSDPMKQKEKQEEILKYIIEKMKNNKKIDLTKYLDILEELNQKPTNA